MTPESDRLIRESWERLLPVGDAMVESFYSKLFESNPELQKLFRPTDMKEQRRKFLVMLSEIIRVIDTPELLISEVADSGRRHVAYGVQDRDYEDVGAALLWAISQTLGHSCTPEVLSAWREAYDLLAAVMRRGHAHEWRELPVGSADAGAIESPIALLPTPSARWLVISRRAGSYWQHANSSIRGPAARRPAVCDASSWPRTGS